MALKHLIVYRTLRTAIGTLRPGIVWGLNPDDEGHAKVIQSVTDKGTAKKPQKPKGEVISKAEAERRKAAVESLQPTPETVDGKEQAMRGKAELEQLLTQARKDMGEQVASLKKAQTALKQHEATLADVRAENATLSEKVVAQTTRADTADAALAQSAKTIEKAETDLAKTVKRAEKAEKALEAAAKEAKA